MTVTFPPVPNGTSSSIATRWPATNSTLGTTGLLAPTGKTVTEPALAPPDTVSVNNTDATPEDGTPPRPAAVTGTEPAALNATRGTPTPEEVSAKRDTATARTAPGAGDTNPAAWACVTRELDATTTTAASWSTRRRDAADERRPLHAATGAFQC